MSLNLLSEEFLAKYPDFPEHHQEIGKFVYLRTYSRYLPQLKRRETFKETVARAVQYNVSLAHKHVLEQCQPVAIDLISKLRNEAEEFFHSMFNLKQFLSGRTMWVGGTENSVAEKFPLANFNCAFTNIESLYDLCDLFYLLLIGTGVGFKCTPEMASKLEPVRNDLLIKHDPYNTLYPFVKVAESSIVVNGDRATIYVGDSKEGWVYALKLFLDVLTKEEYTDIKVVKMNYDYVRKAGERLKTFGGTASGADPLIELFQLIERTIKNEVDSFLEPPKPLDENPNFVQFRPIQIVEIANGIGYNVVVGGVRRTAEIALGSPDDLEFIFAKYGINGIWDEQRHLNIIAKLKDLGFTEWAEKLGKMKLFDAKVRPLHHRRMSNNSIAFTDKPERELLNLVFEMMQGEGEPGFVNLRELALRRLQSLGFDQPSEEMIQEFMYYIGMNPCAEIDLWSKGVCNLTTVNVYGFVNDFNGTKTLDREGLLAAQIRSARAGLRMTLVDLEEMPWAKDPLAWRKTQHRDRLLGCSLTGWKDAMDALDYSVQEEKELLAELKQVARNAGIEYAKELRIPAPLLDTTVKPEGTLSKVANAVSEGLHQSHHSQYIQRIRINAHDPLAKTVVELGWAVHPETGTPGETREEQLQNARTLVIEFPVKSGAKRIKADTNVEEQFETYFNFQKHYSAHNSSNTIDIKAEKGEWEKAEQIVWDNWDRFTAVSFLAYDGGTYQLMPKEVCSVEEYESRKATMKPLDMDVLQKYEVGQDSDDVDNNCAGGECGVR